MKVRPRPRGPLSTAAPNSFFEFTLLLISAGDDAHNLSLAAVDGLEVATPMFRGAVIPITVVILALLFTVQHRGTSRVGPIFGPVLIIWFIVLAVLGVWQIQSRPDILRAFNFMEMKCPHL